MTTEVKIPALGESISSGILSTWHVQDGDIVSSGQLIYELETDKITSEGHAESGGKISLKVAEGDEVEIGAVVAVIDESVAAPASDDAQPQQSQQAASDSQPEPTSKADFPPSPAVRRIAAETGIDPAEVSGTGKAGRVTKADMLAASESRSEPSKSAQGAVAPAAEPTAAPQPDSASRTTRRKLTPMRRRIAERLVAAQQGAALLTTFNEVDMSAVMNLRKRHQETFVKTHGIKLGFMSFFIKATVHALKAVPAINATLDGDELTENHYYDIGVAVGTERGLVVPVVRDCDQLGFAGIEQAILDYAKKAREGKIQISDMQGGVFTISNGGIYGSMLSTPIINPPQSGILGLHNIKERAVVVDGEIVIRPMMYLALTYDHRVVDGKEAVTFLVKIKEAIEDPSSLLLEL